METLGVLNKQYITLKTVQEKTMRASPRFSSI
jgi:hypothetical protein